jgi:ABC-type transporter Mla subunit MlaD
MESLSKLASVCLTLMSNSEESRLDRAERLILGLAEQSSRFAERSDTIQQQVNLNSSAIAQLIQTMQELAEIQARDSQRFDQSIVSINAALERIDRVMDYLMRRDGDRPPGEPA